MKRLKLLSQKRELILVGVSCFALGAGLALAYVLGNPIRVVADTKYICTFKTPEGWIWPEES